MAEHDNPIKEILFEGEGYCKERKEQKKLVLVELQQGGIIGRRDPITGEFIRMPRVGFCAACALRLAKAGRFRDDDK
jgi:hypothetical protein